MVFDTVYFGTPLKVWTQLIIFFYPEHEGVRSTLPLKLTTLRLIRDNSSFQFLTNQQINKQINKQYLGDSFLSTKSECFYNICTLTAYVQTFDSLTKAQKKATFCARFVCQTNAQAVTLSTICRRRSSHHV
jgi:hypothetical protein